MNSAPRRQIIGFLNPTNNPDHRLVWNQRFAKEGIDAFCDFYRTRTDQLQLRLSEMFLLERRGYIVGESLREGIVDLLDVLHSPALEKNMVDTVVNEGGVLHGYLVGDDMGRRYELWFGN